MSRATWAARLIEKRARRRVILRRNNNLLTGVVLAAPVTPTSTSLTLKAASGRLTGGVVRGSRFTIAGITGTFTVSSDSEAAVSGILPVPFSPSIPSGQSAAIGAAVIFTQKYFEVEYPMLNRQVSDVDQKAIEGGEAVRLLPFDTGKEPPRLNDLLDGAPIVRLQEIDADDGIAYYRCHVNQGVAT